MNDFKLISELCAGGLAGIVGVSIGYPLDLVKVRLQTAQNITAWSCFRQLLKAEGFYGLYKGLSAPLLAQFFMNSLSFAGDSLAIKFLEPKLKKGDSPSPMNTIFAGAFGGFVQCLVLVPSDLIKVKMQIEGMQSTKTYNSTAHCLYSVVQKEGISGLYKGFLITALREAPSFAIYFGVYKNSLTWMKNTFEKNNNSIDETLIKGDVLNYSLMPNSPHPTASIMLAGGLAGAASWTAVYPVDVIKTYVQIHSSSSNSQGGLISTVRALHKKYGIKIFFRGLGTTIIRAFPVNAATFYVYETLKELLEL